MSVESVTIPQNDSEGAEPEGGQHVHRLKKNAIGLVGVLFLSVATAAPITAMVGNVPIAIGSGNGAGAPAGYMVATVVLGLFAIGYASMAKHITATGAFYGMVSQGMGRVPSLAAGLLTTLAYIVFEPALVGIFGYFGSQLMNNLFGLQVNWIFFAVFMLVANAVLTYYDVSIGTKILGVFLVAEIFMLTLMAVSVVVHGGGPQGWSWESLNPLSAFQNVSGKFLNPVTGKTALAVGAAGIGLFFAFWSWVGFESTAMYGEESKNPKKIIPIAIMTSVLGIGVFYILISRLAIVGTGPTNAIDLAQDPNTAPWIFFGPVQHNLGQWAAVMFQILLMSGSFACGMAFQSCTAHYIHAVGREGFIPGLANSVGRTHARHGSPHIAGFVQSIIATIVVFAFFFSGRDPYASLYTLMAILGTGAILIVQAMAAFSVIGYFHVRKQHQETAHWFKTFLSPLLGGIGMVYVCYLLLDNAAFAASGAASDPVFVAIPYIIGAVTVAALVIAFVVRVKSPWLYAWMGRITLEESSERDASVPDSHTHPGSGKEEGE
ncbi:MAG: APC family permease [Microbacteriaceae bacterium]|nr:MAG: APC family permease [Microbacteriaceae bacterium]